MAPEGDIVGGPQAAAISTPDTACLHFDRSKSRLQVPPPLCEIKTVCVNNVHWKYSCKILFHPEDVK